MSKKSPSSAVLATTNTNCTLLATAIGLALASAATHAAEPKAAASAQQLPKVSVQADEENTPKKDTSASPKRTAPLRDLPQTVNVIPQTVIEAQNATTLRDILRNTPGITFQAGEGGGGLPGDQNFTLRGFSAKSSIFTDGMRDLGSYARDSFYLEQVEVSKGPAATVAGRSATGGAIDQVTKMARLGTINSSSFGLGTDSYERATADFNQPLTDHIAVRFNAMYNDSQAPNRDIVENNRWGFSPSVAFGLGTPTRLTLGYVHMDQDNVPDYGLPWNTPAGTGAGINLDFDNFYGLKNYDFEDIQLDMATGRFEFDMSETLRFQNTYRYVDNSRDSAITAPRPPNRQLQRRTMEFQMWANRANISLDFNAAGMAHTLSTGTEMSRETTRSRNSAQSTNQPPITDVNNPNPYELPISAMPANTGNPSKSEVKTLAMYAFDTVALSDRWQLTTGVRWENFDVAYALTNLTSGVTTELTTEDSVFNWQGGLVFKPRENGSIYFGYGTSFDPSFEASTTGPSLGGAVTDATNPNLAPEKSRNFELGTKWDFIDGKLALTSALFRVEKINARTRATNGDPYVLSGKQKVDGVELGLTGLITDRWSVYGGYSMMDSEVVATAVVAEQDAELAYTPENSLNLWTTYAFNWGLEIGAGAQFADGVFRNATNTADVPSYWLFDAMASYAINEKLTLRFNGSNLADKKYVDRIGGGHFIPGAGRLVSLTAIVGF